MIIVTTMRIKIFFRDRKHALFVNDTVWIITLTFCGKTAVCKEFFSEMAFKADSKKKWTSIFCFLKLMDI